MEGKRCREEEDRLRDERKKDEGDRLREEKEEKR
jgi:hypothetical protein